MMNTPYPMGLISGAGISVASNVALLLRFDGANGSTSFVDSSNNNHALTGVGGITHSTANGNFVGSTGLFAAGKYLHTPDSTTFDMLAGAFTVEAQVDLDYDWEHCLVSKTSSTSGLEYEWGIRVSFDSIVFYYGKRGNNQSQIKLLFPSTLVANTKYHVAIVRNSSGEWRCYLNGVVGTQYQVAPLGASLVWGSVTTGIYTNAVNLGNTTNRLAVGYAEAGFWQFYGDMKYLRFSLAAEYSGNFTPPTML